MLDLTMEKNDPVDLLRINTSVGASLPIANQDRRGILNAFSTARRPRAPSSTATRTAAGSATT